MAVGIGTALSVGASLVGGAISSKGAKSAASAQSAAANKAGDNTLEMYYQSRDDLAPYRSAGTSALDAYTRMVLGSGADREAVARRLGYTDAGTTTETRMRIPGSDTYNQYGQGTEYLINGEWQQNPSYETGIKYTDEQNSAIDAEIAKIKAEGDPERYSEFYKSPGYQFRLDEGTKTVENSAAARGGLLSGNTLKALEQYSQNYASGEYGNYLSQVAGIANSGQAAAGTTGQLGSAASANYGNALMAAGDAQAQGAIGQANSWTTALNGVAGSFGGMSSGGGYYTGSNINGDGAITNAFSRYSDIRLKTDIIPMGEKNGLPWYEFRYLWDDKKRYRGVMAQDVMKVAPDAVNKHEGYMSVDYDMLGLKMEEVVCH